MLEAQICDVWGAAIGGATIIHTTDGGGLTVTEPLNDSRTAELTISCHDPVARHALPLSRVLSVTYGPFLIFKGPILQTSTDYAAGTIRISAHDATIRLKHHYHRYGDEAVDDGYTLDGRGMRTLVESSNPTDSQLARDVPPNGILWGNDTTTHRAALRKVQRGSNVFESLQNVAALILDDFGDGLDFRFRPVDRDHFGVDADPPPGAFCELDTANRIGADHSDTVIFEHGAGTDTAANIVHEPQGDLVRNWFAVVIPGGEKYRGDPNAKAVMQNNASQEDYGVMQGWESSGQKGDSNADLENKAKAWVDAYHLPPDFFTVTPRPAGSPNVPQYGSDYRVGDTIRARARTGQRSIDLVGRIMTCTIQSVDQAGNVRVDLACVPSIGAEFDPDDETG
jgi:hypothetical protein